MEGENDVFEIERVLESSVKKGIRYYRVRWKGFGEDEDTWEPEENLFDCKDVLGQYWKKSRENKQTKVKKRKSESTSPPQTSKTKKKKCGRTTNNSTIARIDSSSSQDENILFPDTNKRTSSIKHSKTKRKHGSDKEIRLKKNRSDTSQENKSSSKSKENTVKKKKRKKEIDKDSSLKSELEQPHETKQILDENENTKETNQTLTSPEENTPAITIEDAPADNSTNTKGESALQRENSRESLGNRSLGKRRSWSSYEASPEFVPEYCDETLAYDICSEEEYEYFGDTGYFVKDSIGYEESNYFEPTERLATDESLVEDDDHVKDDEGHLKDDEDHVNDDEEHVKGDDDHVKDDEGHVKDDEGHVNDDEEHVKGDEDHVKDDEDHVKDVDDHVKDDEDHVKNDGDHVKDNEDHVKDDGGHVKDDNDRVKDGEDHVEDDEGHVEDDEGHVEDDEGHVKDYYSHVNNKGNNEAISSVKEARTKEQKQGDTTSSIPEVEHQLSSSTSRDTGIRDHDIQQSKEEVSPKKNDVLQHKKEGFQFADRHIDTLNNEASTAPELNTEESGDVSKTLENDDIRFNKSLSDGGDKTATVGDMKTLKKDNLKLKMRSSSSGDSAECMSPEFGRLPEPRKGYFDRVFAEKRGDEKETETLTHEKENNENDDCKDEPGNTGTQKVHGNDSCHDPKSEAHAEATRVELSKSISNVAVKNSDVTPAEQSVGNASADEKLLHGDTKSEEQPQILEPKAPESEKSNSVEMKCECSESENNTHDVLLDISQSKSETVSNIDDVKEQTYARTGLSPIDKERKLSEEETAHCLLDLSSVRIGIASKSEINKVSIQSSNEETPSHMKHSNVPDVDLTKSGKLESGKERSNVKGPRTSSAKNENIKESKQQLTLKRKSDENNSEKFGKKTKIFLNLPFIEQGSKGVLDILDDAMKPPRGGETGVKGKRLSSNDKTITLMTDRKEVPPSKSTKDFRTRVETTSTGSLSFQESSSEQKSNYISQTLFKSSETATDKTFTLMTGREEVPASKSTRTRVETTSTVSLSFQDSSIKQKSNDTSQIMVKSSETATDKTITLMTGREEVPASKSTRTRVETASTGSLLFQDSSSEQKSNDISQTMAKSSETATDKTITLMTDQEELPASKSTKDFRTRVETTSTGSLPFQNSSSGQKSNDISQTLFKSSETATDKTVTLMTNREELPASKSTKDFRTRVETTSTGSLPFQNSSSGQKSNDISQTLFKSSETATDKTVTLMTNREELPASKSTKDFRTRVETTSTGSLPFQDSSSEQKSNDISQTMAKSSETTTDQSRASLTFVPSESQIKQNVSVAGETTTSDSSSVNVTSTSSDALEQKSTTPSLSKPAPPAPAPPARSPPAPPAPAPPASLPEPEIVQQATPGPAPDIKKNETHPVPKEQLSFLNTSGKKPETIVVVQNNKSDLVSSQQGLTKTTEVLNSVNDKKDLHPQYTQTMEGPSTTVLLKQSSPSSSHGGGAMITQVYGKGRYEGPKQGNDPVSWSGGPSKTYPYSVQFGTTSVNQINQNLYSDSPSANPFIVSHLNQKGFSVPPSSFTSHFNQQQFSTQPNTHVNPKPFSAVAGINWYPENQTQTGPRQMRLIAPRFIAPRPLYYVPAFPMSSQYSQQVLHNSMYARALQEMAKRRQPESLGQSVSSGFSNKEYSSSIDADRAWYAKHVGSTSTVNSSQTIKTERKVGENIKAPSSTSGTSQSNNIKVNISESKGKDDFSSSVAETHSTAEKTVTKSSSMTAETKKGDLIVSSQSGSCLVNETKNSSTDKEKECSGIKQELRKDAGRKISDETSISHGEPISDLDKGKDSKTTSNLSKSKASSLSTDSKKLTSGVTVSQSVESTSTDTGNTITKSKGKVIDKDKDKNKDKGKDIDQGKSKDKLTANSESDKKSISHSLPDSKQSSLKDIQNTNQKSTNEKSENRSSGNSSRSGSKEKERCRDSSKDKKEKRNDSEKLRGKDKEIPRKKGDSSKTDFRSKEDDHRSKRDSKGKELKKQESVDSEVEFDLDDYSPGEVIIEKENIVKLLLNHGANINIKDNTGSTPLIAACEQVEKMHVSHTGIPTAMSLREVKSAIKQGDSATVLASLAGGMNIDSQDSVTGMTLLMRAVSFGQENIVKLLLNHGANINIKDNTGSTPLIAACEQGFENIVSLLLNAEIDIKAKQTLSGETALIKACVKGHYSVVAMLLAHGADCQMRSVSGLTAAQLAAQSGHFEIRDMLESHSKKLQRCVETAIASCLCDSSKLMYPPLLPFVSLYPAEGQKFTYHFHCSNLLLRKTILLFCLRAVFSRSGQVDLSFSKDNGVHTVLLNGSLQSPVLCNNKSVFILQPKLDTNRLILQTYQSHVHLLVCIYAAELDESILNIEPSPMNT